jgi:hypothetical protein
MWPRPLSPPARPNTRALAAGAARRVPLARPSPSRAGRHLAPLACAVLSALALAAAVRAEPVQTLSREQFFQTVHTVALEPCRFPEEFGFDDTLSAASDSVARLIEQNLTAQFARAGIRVIPATAYARQFAAGVDSAGGLYDPFTGEVDADLAMALVGRAHAAVAATDTVDAWVLPRVLLVSAKNAKGTAQWSGRSEVFDLERERIVPAYKSGIAPALTLLVTVESAGGQALYRNEGGLQLIAHIRGKQIVPLPSSAWLREPRSVGWAVELAVWPLLTSSPKWDVSQ